MATSNHKDVNIYDIARILNVSTATVSRALKNNPAVNKATRKKIVATARKMGYRPNNFASSLRSQKTNTIGVIIHELNSNFIISVLTGIEKVTAEAGYDIIIAHSSETAAKEIANAQNLFYKRVDGLIASLAYDTENMEHFDPFFRKGVPVVFFDRVEEQMRGVKIVIDNVRAGAMATDHLIQQGCRDIVHMTGNLRRNVYSDRLKGYKEALLAHGLPYREDRVIVNDLSAGMAVEAFADGLVEEFRQKVREVGAERIGAFVAEPVQASGGVIVPPPGYLKRIRDICRDNSANSCMSSGEAMNCIRRLSRLVCTVATALS